jgi:CRISPR-associated protein Csb1
MIDGLTKAPRLILKAELAPAIGSTFQPTGFPDLGAAEFERPSGNGGPPQKALLVESVQSLANHLESTAWDKAGDAPAPPLSKLPYLEVHNKEGRFLTSSRLEPHRLAGSYVRGSKVSGENAGDWMVKRVGAEKGIPLDWRALYSTLFQIDPLCLVHGVFFSDPKWKGFGNPRVRRAVTAVIEAHGTRPVVSGGVKRDDVSPTVEEGRGSSEGFGFVPFGRTEYTAERIELAIAVDLEQIRGYGLGQAEADLLVAVALWEIRALLDKPLRLRTACDLEVASIEATRPEDWELPELGELEAAIASSPVEFEAEGPRSAEFE